MIKYESKTPANKQRRRLLARVDEHPNERGGRPESPFARAAVGLNERADVASELLHGRKLDLELHSQFHRVVVPQSLVESFDETIDLGFAEHLDYEVHLRELTR